MYIYLDETESGNSEFVGYGCLISNNRIERSVIDFALNNLFLDKDRFFDPCKKLDDRTLGNGFFHAADDSKNAHSHLCKSINDNVEWDFYSYIFHSKHKSFSNIEDAYYWASKLSVISLFSRAKELDFIFEGRNGLSAKNLFEKWWPELWSAMRANCFVSPFIPKYYPKVTFSISDKSEPGLQVVDFVLWSSQRAHYSKDSKWLGRIKSWAKGSTSGIDAGLDGHSIRKMDPSVYLPDRYDSFDCPSLVEYQYHISNLSMMLVNVQSVINKAFLMHDKNAIDHFLDDINYLFFNRSIDQNINHIYKMADCFIKLFDNINVISKDNDRATKKFWLSARKCMAHVFHEGLDAHMHLLRLSDTRSFLISEKPELLDAGIEN